MITELTKENFDTEVNGTDKVVLIDFYADWCGPCKMQAPIVDELAEEMDDAKFCKLNVDDQQELAMEFGVMSIPTIMVVKNKKVVHMRPGVHQKAELKEVLEKNMAAEAE
jgi:thioredoxin 1